MFGSFSTRGQNPTTQFQETGWQSRSNHRWLNRYFQKNSDVWNQIFAKYDLRSRKLRDLVGHGDQHADFAFAYGAAEGPRAFVSTIKLRQAGFTKTIDTEGSFRNALRSLTDRKLRPPS